MTAHVTIQGALAPKIDLSAFGTAAVSTERTETDPNRLPPGFQLERPKGRVECFLYYLNNDPQYLVFEEEGRDKMIERWGAERVAARDWHALSDAEQSRWKQLTKEENDRRAAALKEYEEKLAASWRACERLADLVQSRDHRYPEFAPTPSPQKIYFQECAARPTGQTTLECHDATRLALLEVPDPIKAACVTKATTLRRGRWKDVREYVPSPLRELGDASAAKPCTWGQGAAFAEIDVAACPCLAARLAEARRLQGLPEPLSPLPKLDRDAEVDEDSWRSVFKQTARAARPRARMEHVDDAGPGRVERPPPRARAPGIDIQSVVLHALAASRPARRWRRADRSPQGFVAP